MAIVREGGEGDTVDDDVSWSARSMEMAGRRRVDNDCDHVEPKGIDTMRAKAGAIQQKGFQYDFSSSEDTLLRVRGRGTEIIIIYK